MAYQLAIYADDHKLLIDRGFPTLEAALAEVEENFVAPKGGACIPFSAEVRDGIVEQMTFHANSTWHKASRREWERRNLDFKRPVGSIVIQSARAYAEHLADRRDELAH